MRLKPTLLDTLLSLLAIWLTEIGPYLLPGATLHNWFYKYSFTIWGTLLRPFIACLLGFAVGAFIATLLEDLVRLKEIKYGTALSTALVVVGTVMAYWFLKWL